MKAKRFLAMLLALVMLLGLLAGCTGSKEPDESEDPSGNVTQQVSRDYPITPEELGSGEVKWSEEKTADGWMKVTNDGGDVLGYSPDSGVELIQVDGYAFKDLNRNGKLDLYEDWRQDDVARATALANMLSGEEIVPLMTHGDWAAFGATIQDDDMEYINAGGRSGTTSSSAMRGNTAMAVSWTNALQAACEGAGNYGIPAIISTNPKTISDVVCENAMAATFDIDLVHEIAVQSSKQYRAVGITMLLGPQIDLYSNPAWYRGSGTYSEDPALNRDIAAAYIDGAQSTYDADGNDLGWGEGSVVTVAKHFVGTGAAEGGRDDHYIPGKFMVFPGDSFGSHLVPFFDGALNLSGATGEAGGIMPSYGILYSEDGKYGELIGNAYNEFTIGLLRNNGYDGLLVTDWSVTSAKNIGYLSRYNMDHLTVPERFAVLFKLGNDQIGGVRDIETTLEGYAVLVEDIGEEAALELVRNSARRIFTVQMHVDLFDNPYVSKETALASVYTDEALAFSQETQEKSIVLLKNSGNIIHEYDPSAEKATVYIPYTLQLVDRKNYGYKPAVDLELAAQYYNVVTDMLGEPTGTDANGDPVYTAEDIIRANKEELAACDYVIISMYAPYVQSAYDEENDQWLPASLQYEQYTANSSSVRRTSIAGDIITQELDTEYGPVTQDVQENRSYYGNTAAIPETYENYETLQYVKSVIPEDCKIIVVMNTPHPFVWSEVEPLADAILLWFNCYPNSVFDCSWFHDESIMNVITGQVEPSALLPYQMPASMDAVEAQNEDEPRDMECYVDSEGNTYDFAFGLNWSGVINDERVAVYSAPVLTAPESITLN